MRLQGQLIGEMYSAAMDIKPSTPLISWSLAKSVTSAIVGVRSVDSTIETAFDPYQLATTPVWNASEVAARNITGKRLPGLPLLVGAEPGRARMRAAPHLWVNAPGALHGALPALPCVRLHKCHIWTL